MGVCVFHEPKDVPIGTTERAMVKGKRRPLTEYCSLQLAQSPF